MTEPNELRLLIVDDDASVRDSLVNFFEDRNFKVFAAESAERALELPELGKCAAAIVDMRLPGMNGEEFILKIHKNHPSIKCLVYTGSAGFGLTPALEDIGITTARMFDKPMEDLNVLLEAVKKLLPVDEKRE